jgi:hypothetical protein
VFSRGFRTNILYSFFVSPLQAIFPAYVSLYISLS